MQPMLNIALRAARLAGEQIARASERLDLIKSEQANIGDFLKETASKAEETIVYTIQKAYPNHTIEGLFTGKHNAQGETIEVEWKVNAIDSISNFQNGIPAYAICMTATQNGRIEHALILNPITSEEFTASRGNGAQLNGKRIRVGSSRTMEQCIIATSYLNTPNDKSQYESYKKLVGAMQAANATLHNNGSPALNMAYTAAARYDGFIQLNLDRDIMEAGSLLIQEAGGLMGDPQGGNTYKNNGDTVAANPKLFKNFIQLLRANL